MSSSDLDEKELIKGDSLSERSDSDNEENCFDAKRPLFEEMSVDDNVIDLDQNDFNFDEDENDDQKCFQNSSKLHNINKPIEAEATKVNFFEFLIKISDLNSFLKLIDYFILLFFIFYF